MKEHTSKTVEVEIPFNGGVDESSQVTDIAPGDCLEMENYRLSKDGKRVEKRLGSASVYASFAEDVYGYTTYYNATPAFCQVAALESKIVRKVASASWATVHTFSSSIVHPQKILEIHDKQFIINEKDSRLILKSAAGTDYRIGIPAPTTLPTIAVSDTETAPTALSEDFNYADEAALLTGGWVDGDVSATSELSTSDPNSDQGPEADSKYLRFHDASPTASDKAKRSKTIAVGKNYTLDYAIYFDAIGARSAGNHTQIHLYNGENHLELMFETDGLSIHNGLRYFRFAPLDSSLNNWVTWKFIVNNDDPDVGKVKVWRDDGTGWKGFVAVDLEYRRPDTTAAQVVIEANTEASGNPDVYLDSISCTGPKEETTSGLGDEGGGTFRYAVTFARSGNFGVESNPIKSIVGTAAGTVAVLDDCTSSGTYTGDETRTFRVQIDGTGAIDTIKWSDDKGTTWQSETQKVTTTMYLSYGITLTFGAVTGHTSGDYWDITCSVCSADAGNENISLSAIPVDSNSTNTGTDQRKIYRSLKDGSRFYWLATINDNTTTTFVDNIPDKMLGREANEDHDPMPNGKFAEWWDNCLWVSGKKLDAAGAALEANENCVYYSLPDEPEHFDYASSTPRRITIRKGDADDEITGMIAYKDILYVFKRTSIYIIMKRPDGSYGRYRISSGIGCVAPWSLIEVQNILMFLSFRGWELFNGADPYSMTFSVKLKRTLATIDASNYDMISTIQYRKTNEVLMSIPDITGGTSNKACVYNYAKNAFYVFNYHKVISCLAEARDSSEVIQNYIGTRDGFLFTAESTYRDGTTAITAKIRKGWVVSKDICDWLDVSVDYEIPDDMTLTLNSYTNFEYAAKRTDSLTGETVSGTDVELRRPLLDESEHQLRGKTFAFKLTNAENLGGAHKINKAYVTYRPRFKGHKISGDASA